MGTTGVLGYIFMIWGVISVMFLFSAMVVALIVKWLHLDSSKEKKDSPTVQKWRTRRY